MKYLEHSGFFLFIFLKLWIPQSKILFYPPISTWKQNQWHCEHTSPQIQAVIQTSHVNFKQDCWQIANAITLPNFKCWLFLDNFRTKDKRLNKPRLKTVTTNDKIHCVQDFENPRLPLTRWNQIFDCFLLMMYSAIKSSWLCNATQIMSKMPQTVSSFMYQWIVPFDCTFEPQANFISC